MQEGDDGDGKEPKPEEEIELLVHNVIRKNTHSLEDLLMATTAKLRGEEIEKYGYGRKLKLTVDMLHVVTIGKVRRIGS